MTVVSEPRAAGAGLRWGAAALMSASLAPISLRYFVGLGPFPPTIGAGSLAVPWLAIHAAGAAVALLVGALPRRHPPITFLAWFPNLLAAEPYLRRPAGNADSKPLPGKLTGGSLS